MTTVDKLIDQERERTGLSDFGSESFREGLVALIAGAEAAGTFNELGMTVLQEQAIGFLSTRLSVEDCYRRHPEIDEQEIMKIRTMPDVFSLVERHLPDVE